jgi:hypothetical protein
MPDAPNEFNSRQFRSIKGRVMTAALNVAPVG